MNKYEKLERLYYKRKYTRYTIYFVVFILIFIGIYFVFQKSNSSSTQNPQPIIKHQERKKEVKKEIKKDKNETKKINKVKIIKEEVIKKIEKNETIEPKKEETKKNYQTIKKLVLYPIFPDISNEIQPKPKKVVNQKIKEETIKTKPKEIVKSTIKTKHTEIKIIVKNKKNDIEDLIKIYNNEADFDIAMKIANLYFYKKEYNQSIIWAKKANKLNPEDSSSWYLFAQNLIKLNQKEKAKQVLIAYLNSYGTDEKIENLLRSIK